MQTKKKDLKNQLEAAVGKLNALNPLAVLSRGYGAIFNDDYKIIKSVYDIKEDEKINIKLYDGEISASINQIRKKDVKYE